MMSLEGRRPGDLRSEDWEWECKDGIFISEDCFPEVVEPVFVEHEHEHEHDHRSTEPTQTPAPSPFRKPHLTNLEVAIQERIDGQEAEHDLLILLAERSDSLDDPEF